MLKHKILILKRKINSLYSFLCDKSRNLRLIKTFSDTPLHTAINEDEALHCEISSSEEESTESSLVSDPEEQVFDVHEMMELPAAVKELYKRFCISENVGFLIENPVRKLPEQFQKWEELARNVVDLLEQNKFRKSVEEELKIIGKP